MTLIVDTSGLLAALDASEPQHAACVRALTREDGPFVLSPFVMAELDYMLSVRASHEAQLALLAEVGRGAYLLAPFNEKDVDAASDVMKRHQGIGLADAAAVVLAGRHRTNAILTLDERHFRTLRTPSGQRFTLLPADL